MRVRLFGLIGIGDVKMNQNKKSTSRQEH